METLTIQVKNHNVMEALKKVLGAMSGVVVLSEKKVKMTGLEEAMDDVRHGRVTEYESADDMFDKLGI